MIAHFHHCSFLRYTPACKNEPMKALNSLQSSIFSVLIVGSVGFMALPLDFPAFIDFVRHLGLPSVVLSAFKFIIAFPIVFHSLNGIRFLVSFLYFNIKYLFDRFILSYLRWTTFYFHWKDYIGRILNEFWIVEEQMLYKSIWRAVFDFLCFNMKIFILCVKNCT